MPSEDAALDRLWDALPTARLVGGAVRDRLAGLPAADHDLATPDTPDSVVRSLAIRGIRTIATGLAHGTVTAVVEGRPFEITTLRRDVGTDGRHARTEWTDDWREDAARRDFTINAMSEDRSGVLHDYFDGRDDLAAGRVRFVGEAGKRIDEDHLRILRFLRFHARFARAEPDAAAAAAIASRASLIARLSAERVWSELKRLLALPAASQTLRLASRLGVLGVAIPEGADPGRVEALERIGAPADPILRLAALLAADAPAFAARLRLSGDDARHLLSLRTGPVPEPDADADAIRRLLADHPPVILAGRAWLAQPPDADPSAWTALRARIDSLPAPVFPLAGRDALALGAEPGKPVGEALRRTRDWWLARGATADRDGCLAELARQLRAFDMTS